MISNDKIKELGELLLGHSKLPIDVIYDVDDVLNTLNETVFNKLGWTWRPKRFNTRECDDITREQQDIVLRLYRDPEMFRTTAWSDGAKDIANIENTGLARVGINSNSLNPEVVGIKRHRLLTDIPNINPDRLTLQCVGTEEKKSVHADIIIEDHIMNTLRYGEHCIKILINKTWNTSGEYPMDEEKLHIVRVDSLLEANEVIARIVDYIDRKVNNNGK